MRMTKNISTVSTVLFCLFAALKKPCFLSLNQKYWKSACQIDFISAGLGPLINHHDQ